jgi:hypothetical protein
MNTKPNAQCFFFKRSQARSIIRDNSSIWMDIVTQLNWNNLSSSFATCSNYFSCFDNFLFTFLRSVPKLASPLRFVVYRVQRTMCGHSWTTASLFSVAKVKIWHSAHSDIQHSVQWSTPSFWFCPSPASASTLCRKAGMTGDLPRSSVCRSP